MVAKKRHVKYLIFFLFIIFLTLVPRVYWRDKIVVDEAKLATVYYTTLLDIGKIAFAFWLAHVYLQKIRFGRVKGQWENALFSLKEASDALLRLDLNSNDYEAQRDKLKEIHQRVHQTRARMDAIALLSKDIEPFIDVVIKTQAVEYGKEMSDKLNEICGYFKTGGITSGKPLSIEQADLVRGIYDQVERWLQELRSL